MKPINKKERSKAFYKVVGLFLFSFAIAMILGFTTMNINKLSDSKSSNELENLQSQLKFQEEVFAPTIDEVTILLDKVPGRSVCYRYSAISRWGIYNNWG